MRIGHDEGNCVVVSGAPALRFRQTLMRDARIGPLVQALGSWLDNFTGASGAPWLWWAAALVVLLVLLLLGMKVLGLLPR